MQMASVRDETSEVLARGQGSDEASLEAWILGLDGGKGAMLQFLEAVQREFGDQGWMQQLAAAVLPGLGESSVLDEIDPFVFDILGVQRMGHKLLLARGMVALRNELAMPKKGSRSSERSQSQRRNASRSKNRSRPNEKSPRCADDRNVTDAQCVRNDDRTGELSSCNEELSQYRDANRRDERSARHGWDDTKSTRLFDHGKSEGSPRKDDPINAQLPRSSTERKQYRSRSPIQRGERSPRRDGMEKVREPLRPPTRRDERSPRRDEREKVREPLRSPDRRGERSPRRDEKEKMREPLRSPTRRAERSPRRDEKEKVREPLRSPARRAERSPRRDEKEKAREPLRSPARRSERLPRRDEKEKAREPLRSPGRRGERSPRRDEREKVREPLRSLARRGERSPRRVEGEKVREPLRSPARRGERSPRRDEKEKVREPLRSPDRRGGRSPRRVEGVKVHEPMRSYLRKASRSPRSKTLSRSRSRRSTRDSNSYICNSNQHSCVVGAMAIPTAGHYDYLLHTTTSELGLSPQAESLLLNVTTQAAIKMAAYQKEWPAEKMKNKLIEYLNKAARVVGGVASAKNWEEKLEDFASRFVESFWTALGGTDWLDRVDVNDLTTCVKTSIIGFFPKSDLATVVSNPKFGKACQDYTVKAFDDCRYSHWGWQVFKDSLSSKVAQKKVWNACDAARKTVLKERPDSPETFIARWVNLSIGDLAKDGDINIHMPETVAIKLFSHLVKKAAVPTYLMTLAGGKPPSKCNEISDIVEQAYKAHPPPQRTATPYACIGKGFGKDGKNSGSWNVGGKGSWGGDSWGNNSWDSWDSESGSWDMMMTMMNMWMGGNGGWDAWGAGSGVGADVPRNP